MVVLFPGTGAGFASACTDPVEPPDPADPADPADTTEVLAGVVTDLLAPRPTLLDALCGGAGAGPFPLTVGGCR